MSLDIKIVKKGTNSPLRPSRVGAGSNLSTKQRSTAKPAVISANTSPAVVTKTTSTKKQSNKSSRPNQKKTRPHQRKKRWVIFVVMLIIIGIIGVAAVIFFQPKEPITSSLPGGVVDSLTVGDKPSSSAPVPVSEKVSVQDKLYFERLDSFNRNLADFKVYTDEFKKMKILLSE